MNSWSNTRARARQGRGTPLEFFAARNSSPALERVGLPGSTPDFMPVADVARLQFLKWGFSYKDIIIGRSPNKELRISPCDGRGCLA